MLLVSEAGALAGVWAWEWRRELLLERCRGCRRPWAGVPQSAAFRLLSGTPMPWCCCCAALHARPGEEVVNELSLLRAFAQLLLQEHKYFL